MPGVWGPPLSSGKQGGGFFYDIVLSALRHLSPSSQEVTVEFVSKYRLLVALVPVTAPLASHLNGRTAFQETQAHWPPLGAVCKK